MQEELEEIIPSITAIPDAEKKEKKGIQGQDNEEKDQKMEEVESASGQKTVRAAHVPVPSQVNQNGSNKPDIKNPKFSGRNQGGNVEKEKTRIIKNVRRRDTLRTITRSSNSFGTLKYRKNFTALLPLPREYF